MNKKGLSLVEVMVAVAIMGIVSLGMMSMMENTLKSQRGAQAKDLQRDVTARIRTLLTNRVACLNSLGGGNPTVGFTRANLRDDTNTIRFTAGTDDPTRLLKYIEFRVSNYQAPTQLATLTVTYEKTGSTIGAKTLIENMSIRATVNGLGNITDCFAVGTNTDGFWQVNPINMTEIFYATGNVAIGPVASNDPTEALEVAGNILANMFLFTSDARLKENFQAAPGMVKLNRINAYSFDWIKDGHFDMGVIAQEVEKEFPHLVRTNSSGIKSVNYPGLIPILIQANKDLYADQLEMQKRIIALEEALISK